MTDTNILPNSKFLIVPAQLNALFLKSDQTVMDAMAKFDGLPWSDGERDYHSDTPFLSEAIQSRPFQNTNLTLKSGVHLHWVLPRALRKLTVGEASSIPSAPNRWLITRTLGNNTKQWIVESDYLDTKRGKYNSNSVTVPKIGGTTKQPYYYLGRVLPFESWNPHDSQNPDILYWEKTQGVNFTALGYGELSFNNLYSNCRSVFGFHDHEIMNIIGDETATYEVFGWYDNPNNDVLVPALDVSISKCKLNDKLNLAEVLSDELKWDISKDITQNDYPTNSFYYSKIQVNSHSAAPEVPSFDSTAVGNNATEALSAYLGKTISLLNRDLIEDQLEAIFMRSKVMKKLSDPMANFLKERHLKEFTGEDGGTLWSLKANKLIGQDNNESSLSPLPPTLYQDLHNLNEAQCCFNKRQWQLQSSYQQLYSNWCKYQKSCYPPLGEEDNYPDEDAVKELIEFEITNIIRPLETEISTLKNNISTYMKDFIPTISTVNQQIKDSGYEWVLLETPAPRFYQSRDPVILFARKSNSQQTDTNLIIPCVWSSENKRVTDSSLQPISKNVISSLIKGKENDFCSSTSNWSPQVLEWLVELNPIESNSYFDLAHENYASNFLQSNFTLSENEIALTPSQNTKFITISKEYEGKTYISTSIKGRYQKELRDYIMKKQGWSEKNFETQIKSYKTSCGFQSPSNTAILAYKELENLEILTQSLGGFRLSLLQYTQSLKLPISDPLGFSNYQAFANKVKGILEGYTPLVIEPTNYFLPFQTGQLKLMKLKLTGHFGLASNIELPTPIRAKSFRVNEDPHKLLLNPCYSAPTRLNFRWLAAASNNNQVEMNSHPGSTPICGWLLPNYLTNSLYCYNEAGMGIGYFDQDNNWHSMPGSSTAITLSQLSPTELNGVNLHLYNVLKEIQTTPLSISDLENAQNAISPESTAGHDSLAILMGRPIAIVRASISLECKGKLASDQGWNALRAELNNSSKITNAYEETQVSIRLGEYGQLNDGLIGYWSEESNKLQSYKSNSSSEGTGVFSLTLNSTPKIMTLLMEPNGLVHATCGILPVKSISIPSEQYLSSLKNIQMNFFTAPIITSESAVEISLPQESGYSWDWIEKEDQTNWSSTEEISSFQKGASLSSKQRVLEGWINLKTKK